jgi:hypothetical protein
MPYERSCVGVDSVTFLHFSPVARFLKITRGVEMPNICYATRLAYGANDATPSTTIPVDRIPSTSTLAEALPGRQSEGRLEGARQGTVEQLRHFR